MAQCVALTVTNHDPEGRLNAQAVRVLPLLRALYCHITMVVTPTTPVEALASLRDAGVTVMDGGGAIPIGMAHLGQWRRLALDVALREADQATHLHLCDFDRILHWAEFYPYELQAVLTTLPGHDLTVFGRTPRAFAAHPRVQRDTEAIVNHVFGVASGLPWDVTAASRGLSRRAAEAVVANSQDDTVGTDCSWVLFLRQYGAYTLNYISTEGLEFETLDRYADEIAALGGTAAWLSRLDADPQQWLERLALARLEVESIVRYKG